MRHHVRNRSVLLGVVAALALVLALGAPAAGQATTSDPYGPTVPPTEPPGDPSCSIDDPTVEAGATVTGSVAGVETGTSVSIRLAGSEVAETVADATGTGTFSFTVPDLDPGPYGLVAVGVTFNVTCTDGAGEGFEVLGEDVGREPPGDGSGNGGAGNGGDGAGTGAGDGSGSGPGDLARTGATFLPLVLIAVLLLVLGAAARRRSRGPRTPALR